MATFEPNQTPGDLPLWRSDLSACVVIALLALLIFRLSPIHPINDSKYSMLVSQSLIEHGSFALDAYALPRLAPTQREDYVQNGNIYQLELARGRLYYFFPPGSSVLSVPFVALMKLLGISAAGERGEYQPAGEASIQSWLAAILMSLLAALFFKTSRLCLSQGYSAGRRFRHAGLEHRLQSHVHGHLGAAAARHGAVPAARRGDGAA
jgi:hypothetical protein